MTPVTWYIKTVREVRDNTFTRWETGGPYDDLRQFAAHMNVKHPDSAPFNVFRVVRRVNNEGCAP